MTKYLPPFNATERTALHVEVERLARSLQGRKLEEGDWTALYCRIKGVDDPGWSNLPFRDYLHNGVGVEFKLLMRTNPEGDMGRSLMHPAATRTIDFNEDDSPEKAMREVLAQWGEQIKGFERRIAESSESGQVDARWGVLLWAPDHSQFLYFEERLEKPSPANFRAEWGNGKHRGRQSRNLHIFELESGKKRFSCTLPRNGAKLQPYFDIPTEEAGAVLVSVPPQQVAPFYVGRADLERVREMFPEKADEEIMSELLAAYLERRGAR